MNKTKTSRQFTCPSLFAMALLVCSVQAHAQATRLDGLNRYIEQSMRAWEVPGVAVAVIKDGKIVLMKGYGQREIGKPDSADEHTIFAVASHTKAFTVAALGMLVDEGKLRWDDPVTDYLPGFQLYDPYVTKHMIIRDLLTHRSGLAGWAADHLWYGSTYSREEILRRIRYQQPSGEFRIHFGYSNVIYIVAGQIIPAVAGKSWEEFVQERILLPLGMTATTTTIRALKDRENIATPHLKVAGVVRSWPWYNMDNAAPAGGLNSNAMEMSQWVKLQLNHGIFDGKRLLSEEVIREMHAPKMVMPKSFWLGIPPQSHFVLYGMGWWLFDYSGRKVVQHAGELDGMRSLTTMIPEEQLGIVVLTNFTPHFLTDAIAYWIVDAYLGLPKRDWNAELLARRNEELEQKRQAEEKAQKARVQGTRPSLPLERYAGEYIDRLSGQAEVKFQNGRLVFAHNQKHVADLEHWHFDTFLARWRDPNVTMWAGRFLSFHLDETGNVASLRTIFDNEVIFQRAKEPK